MGASTRRYWPRTITSAFLWPCTASQSNERGHIIHHRRVDTNHGQLSLARNTLSWRGVSGAFHLNKSRLPHHRIKTRLPLTGGVRRLTRITTWLCFLTFGITEIRVDFHLRGWSDDDFDLWKSTLSSADRTVLLSSHPLPGKQLLQATALQFQERKPGSL